jgi:hypothetical protein
MSSNFQKASVKSFRLFHSLFELKTTLTSLKNAIMCINLQYFIAFESFLSPSQPQQDQMHRDYENINTRAQLNRLMHSVLEMIY